MSAGDEPVTEPGAEVPADPAVEADQVGAPADGAAEAPQDPAAAALAEAETRIAELTDDLQRKQAEFVNFRNRAERDKQAASAAAKASVLTALLDVLDDLDRARAHGDLETGPLKSFADKLGDVLTGQGLAAFGAEGDVFDPELHEAVQHAGGDGVPVVATVLRTGYRHGDRVLRHAMVVVEDRAEEPAAEADR